MKAWQTRWTGILYEGEEIQPDTEYGTVNVSFALAPADTEAADEISVFHVSDAESGELKAEELPVTVESAADGTDEAAVVSVETESFSYYVVQLAANAVRDRNKAAAAARAEVGTTGGTRYYKSGESGSWCVYFARWSARQGGLTASEWPETGSTTQLVDWFQEHDRYHDKTCLTWSYNGIEGGGRIDAYVPRPGDFLAIENNGKPKDGPDHTGIVLSVSRNTITSIEGNVSNTVKKVTYNLSDFTSGSGAVIVGVGSPDYGDGGGSEEYVFEYWDNGDPERPVTVSGKRTFWWKQVGYAACSTRFQVSDG